jgi:hypothetical protein
MYLLSVSPLPFDQISPEAPRQSSALHNSIISFLPPSNPFLISSQSLPSSILTAMFIQFVKPHNTRSVPAHLPALRQPPHPPTQKVPLYHQQLPFDNKQHKPSKKHSARRGMESSSVLSGSVSSNAQSQIHDSAPPRTHSYQTRQTMTGMDVRNGSHRMATPPAAYVSGHSNATTPHNTSMSPFCSPTPKSVAFELLFPESPQYRARLPMRVQIFPHDTTDSIVTTVKNFYGLYAGPAGAKGVSFEDEEGNTLIARYENLRNNMVVYVRVIDEPSPPLGAYGSSYHSGSPVLPHAYYPGDGHHMPPPQPAQALNYGQPLSRPTSRTSCKRSISPNGGRGRRSTSASTNPPPIKKSRSRSGFKSRNSSAHGSFADNYSDGMNGYSSGDGAPGSVSSKTKSEHIGNTEISLDNIVEGGRRKRAKFESSVSIPFIRTFTRLVANYPLL